MVTKSIHSGLAWALVFLPSTTFASPFRAWNSTYQLQPSINFTTCDPQLSLTFQFECGSLTVPINYDNPGNGTIDLFVSRWKANRTSLGSLVFNFGGPGDQDLLDNYDIIAVDPRGIGYSNPLTCDKDLWNNAPKAFATDDDSFAELIAFNKNFGESCLELTGPLAGYMDSISTVKDFELLRQALGDDLLNYLGFSYGTLLGQNYAELYPEHVGRMVLDGMVDHSTHGTISPVMTESLTYQATLQQFFSWCNETTECSLSGMDLPAIFLNLTSATSLPTTQCEGICHTTVTGENVLFNAQPLLVWKQSIIGNWFQLADAINQALNGDASAFSPKLKLGNTDTSATSDFASIAVFCQDWGSSLTSSTDLKSLVEVASALLPLTRGAGQAFSSEAYCAGWPAPVLNPPRPLNAEQVAKLPTIMMVNAFFDPSTSAVWAEGVHQQIPSAVQVWRNGAGHTSYLLYGDTSKAMDEFLISGTLPAQGTVLDS